MGLVSLKKGHPEVSFLLGIVTGMRWSMEERAFAVEAYFSNDCSWSSPEGTLSCNNGQLNVPSGPGSPGPKMWKWASSLKNTSASGGTPSRSDSQAVYRALKSRSVSCSTTAILYGWKRSSLRRIRLTVRSEFPGQLHVCEQNVWAFWRSLQVLCVFFHITTDPKCVYPQSYRLRAGKVELQCEYWTGSGRYVELQ